VRAKTRGAADYWSVCADEQELLYRRGSGGRRSGSANGTASVIKSDDLLDLQFATSRCGFGDWVKMSG